LSWQGREIRSEKDRPEGVSIRAWRDIAKSSFSAMAFYWHENFLERHFGPDVRRRYGGGVIKPRSLSWLMRKIGIKRSDVDSRMNVAGLFEKHKTKEDYWRDFFRVAGTMVDQSDGGINYNYHTGGLLDAVTSAAIVRAFPGRFRLEMPLPAWVPGRTKITNHGPDIRAELTVVLPSEIEALQKVGQRVLTQTMQQVLSTGRVPAGARS
jgi:hypothetical protein